MRQIIRKSKGQLSRRILSEMAKAKDRTIDRKLWNTMASQCSRTYKATLGEFARIAADTPDEVLLQKYVAGIIIFKCPCPKSEKEMDVIKAYKNWGHDLINRGITFEDIEKLYNENAPDALIGLQVQPSEQPEPEAETLDNLTDEPEELSDEEIEDIAVEIQDLKEKPTADEDKLDAIEDKITNTDNEESLTPLHNIKNPLSNDVNKRVVSLNELEMAYPPYNILWKNYKRGMDHIMNTLGLNEDTKFLQFTLPKVSIRNYMQSFNIKLMRLFDFEKDAPVISEIFGKGSEYGLDNARLVMKREFFVGPRTVQESVKNLVYKLGTKNIIIQYNSKDLMLQGSQTFQYDKMTFYIQVD